MTPDSRLAGIRGTGLWKVALARNGLLRPDVRGSNDVSPLLFKLWRPQAGPQKALNDCPVEEVFFGGSRGGEKTDGVLGKWALKERSRLHREVALLGQHLEVIHHPKRAIRDA